MKSTNVSANKRKTIGVLDFIYAFGAMAKDQSDDGQIQAMAEALMESAMKGLECLAYECKILERKYKEEMIQKAENMIEEGLGSTEISGETWAAFLLRLVDIQLYKPMKKNGRPQKKGWIKNTALRGHLEDCKNLLYSLSLIFSENGESEDFDAIKLGDKASGIYISS